MDESPGKHPKHHMEFVNNVQSLYNYRLNKEACGPCAGKSLVCCTGGHCKELTRLLMPEAQRGNCHRIALILHEYIRQYHERFWK